jgi:outer membrane protein OmpA-like peptidoglycan-associated protein
LKRYKQLLQCGNSAKGTSAACAQQRADKIAAILKMKGVNVNTAKRVSYGAKRPKYNNSQDNRADITIYSLD